MISSDGVKNTNVINNACKINKGDSKSGCLYMHKSKNGKRREKTQCDGIYCLILSEICVRLNEDE